MKRCFLVVVFALAACAPPHEAVRSTTVPYATPTGVPPAPAYPPPAYPAPKRTQRDQATPVPDGLGCRDCAVRWEE